MRCVQKHKLFHKEKQEKNQGKTVAQENVQKMQKAHSSQRDEISLFLAGVVQW